jgi:cyclic lactone autoinducer peptide
MPSYKRSGGFAVAYQNKGVKIMGKTAMKKLAKVVEKIAHVGAGRVCLGLWCQPKVPAALKHGK